MTMPEGDKVGEGRNREKIKDQGNTDGLYFEPCRQLPSRKKEEKKKKKNQCSIIPQLKLLEAV
jgi:hypothetical protein